MRWRRSTSSLAQVAQQDEGDDQDQDDVDYKRKTGDPVVTSGRGGRAALRRKEVEEDSRAASRPGGRGSSGEA